MRLQKPLSCRVWPVRGKGVGDVVDFACPFFVRSAVISLTGAPPPKVIGPPAGPDVASIGVGCLVGLAAGVILARAGAIGPR